MAEIRNYTMNFGFGRPPSMRLAGLTCRGKLACAEIHFERATAELCYGH
ncbi:MAG TPA: hypothetical protein VJ834_03385 [Burkholderiales bacterium]|jgi:hypothetical protein|nr:hypothetical protein [Burkholderiales bacterium]